MPRVFVKRGTRAQLDAAATAGQLAAGEVYLITDEDRLAAGLSTSSYQAMAKDSEAGGSIENAGAIAWPDRVSARRIVGDVAGTALTTLALTSSRQYFVPFVVPRQVTLTGLRISVTTAAAGTASVGIYDNTPNDGENIPGSLLASATGLDTGTTGEKSGSLSLTLEPGTLYWASLICSAIATLRALPVGSVQTSLGRSIAATTVVSHLYTTGSGSTLPDPASISNYNGTGAVPAIYLLY